MHILQVHNQYQQAGGEDVVVRSEKALLENHHHTVSLFLTDNHTIKNVLEKLTTVATIAYSRKSRQQLKNAIANIQPDIVHVHNFFPRLTPSIYDAAAELGVPVVQTLHNYRTICPGAFLMRDGKICEVCVKHSAYHAVKYGCYRDSTLGTLAVAYMVQSHRQRRTWQTKVSQFIALTEFARQKFISAGLDADKLKVKPNFVTDPLTSTTEKRSGALYVGRLSKEKGLITLLKAWQNLAEIPLTIAGEGEIVPHLKTNITLLGWQTAPQIKQLMRQSAFLIMPSEWYEGFPMVLVEAFAHGLPVIASKLGAMAEIVEDGVTGLHFEAGNANDLANKVHCLQSQPELCKRLGQQARQVYLDNYTPEKNYQRLMAIYQAALN
ncbi:hypothetical protein PN36_11525 [Candidatus Thiomargarita nelsonii]|uniref:Glycosyl transferase family 1 n=1 Tax=Candidatus Thiomargarita nelsonii TaxID=1003181 RepID=A0A0A6RQ02_9GAMM|nr:hypothetical protein PN36_11525 [Candidatus Thiomargarita nelsonii]